ncbi:hypothetical protein [Burkholderia gladioli]|uniref:hypothetical protein n=1 Tax=Burkholderia gladioli TaxID=28095 RepID=UPI001C6004D2|nr:hypothetical protein [Burkholderia gladioli]MBW5284132.1 hypothetical protein [Burkholderia gladioli]
METSLPRGSVLRCRFPYEENPHTPGPTWHYCLLSGQYEFAGDILVAVCYGTSAVDETLFAKHRGSILTVDKQFIKGIDLPKDRGSFIADRVALVPLHEEWIDLQHVGRLDIFREKKRMADAQRASLFEDFGRIEKIMLRSTMDTAANFLKTGNVGLPPSKTLR